MKVVALDADVLGRQRTGDETYVLNLLRELGPLAPEAGIRLVALTRRPDLVPPGVDAMELRARAQELRMAWSLPRALHASKPTSVIRSTPYRFVCRARAS